MQAGITAEACVASTNRLLTDDGMGTVSIMAATGILDNYAIHKQTDVRAWLDRHPRCTFHFVPTSYSRL